MKSSVWLLEESEKFDYHSSYTRRRTTQLSANSAIYRLGSDVFALPLSAKVPAGAEKLAVIYVHDDSVLIVNAQSLHSDTSQAKAMWLVVRKIQSSHGYQLKEGDVIRLASREWVVTEISAGHQALSTHSSTELSEAGPNAQCKICLSHENSQEDPLVAPCACKGSVKYLHVGCLGRWLASKLRHLDQTYRTQYSIPTINCSLCGQALPRSLEVAGQHFFNLGVSKPHGRYIVLQDRISQEVQLWHWEDCHELCVGASYENEIRIAGLSSIHAKLAFDGSELRLRDRRSQFGTLVLVQKPLVLSPGDSATVQCGNVKLQIKLKRSGFLGCFGSRRRSVSFADLAESDLA